MLINLNQNAPHSTFHCSDINTFSDQSMIESTTQKRFARTNNIQQSKIKQVNYFKTSEPPRNIDQFITLNESPKKNLVNNDSFIQEQELFLQLPHSSSKDCYYSIAMTSDRATQSTYLRQKCQFETYHSKNLPFPSKQQAYGQIKFELQVKLNEIMVLEDENMRLKRNSREKEQQFLRISIKQQKQYQCQNSKLQEQIKLLKQEIKTKNQQIKLVKKNQTIANRDIKTLKYEKLLLQRQIQDLYKKKLPKEIKQLMSYRQISLARQIEQLKQQIQAEKSCHQLTLEVNIHSLIQERNIALCQCKHLTIQNHLLNRKIQQYEYQLKYKSDNFEKCYRSLKVNYSKLHLQLKKIKKENLKLLRLQILSYSHHIHSDISSESEDSLDLSTSSLHD